MWNENLFYESLIYYRGEKDKEVRIMGALSKTAMDYVGDVLGEYLDHVEFCMLLDDGPPYSNDEFWDAISELRKVVKKLKKGKSKGIFDNEMLDKCRDSIERDAERCHRKEIMIGI